MKLKKILIITLLLIVSGCNPLTSNNNKYQYMEYYDNFEYEVREDGNRYVTSKPQEYDKFNQFTGSAKITETGNVVIDESITKQSKTLKSKKDYLYRRKSILGIEKWNMRVMDPKNETIISEIDLKKIFDENPEKILSSTAYLLFHEDDRDYIVIRTYTFGEKVKGEIFTAEISCDLKVYLDNGEYAFVDLVSGEAYE